MRGRIWKGDILFADIEELETMDASDIYLKRLNAESLFVHSKMDESNLLEEIKTWEDPPRYGIVQFKENVTLIFLENQKGHVHRLTTYFRMPVNR